MINFFNNLQDREKKLLAIALILIIFFILIILIKGLYDDYKISSKNLNKAKSDYEYVFYKASKLKSTMERSSLSESYINLIITKNDLIDLISELNITKTNELFTVTFTANNINSAATLSENIINKTDLNIKKINYKNFKDSIGVTLIFNF